MNAGAYGSEMKDVLTWARVLAPDGAVHRLEAPDLELGYRTSCIPGKGYVVLEAGLRLQAGDRDARTGRCGLDPVYPIAPAGSVAGDAESMDMAVGQKEACHHLASGKAEQFLAVFPDNGFVGCRIIGVNMSSRAAGHVPVGCYAVVVACVELQNALFSVHQEYPAVDSAVPGIPAPVITGRELRTGHIKGRDRRIVRGKVAFIRVSGSGSCIFRLHVSAAAPGTAA